MAAEPRSTHSLTFKRTPADESVVLVEMLTEEFGFVRARAQGLLKPASKLSASLLVGTLGRVTLVRGKAGWRLVGAVEEKNYYFDAQEVGKKQTEVFSNVFTQITLLTRRLIQQDSPEKKLFNEIISFLNLLLGSTTAVSPERVTLGMRALFLVELGYLDLDLPAGKSIQNFLEELVRGEIVPGKEKELQRKVSDSLMHTHRF